MYSSGQYFITNFDLGVNELELETGESYTFDVQYEPENTVLRELKWLSTNASVVTIDPISNTVTAVGSGTAVLFAESIDGSTFAECTVTVNGPAGKDAAGTSVVEALSDEDYGKLKSDVFRHFYDYVLTNEFDDASFAEISARNFSLIAKVIPGTEIAESEKAAELGMTDVSALQNIHAVVFHGTFEQILTYISSNENLREIAGGGLTFLAPTVTDMPEDNGQKAINLESNVEKVTEVSLAHDLGYKGKGITIAVLDTGLDKNHEQFVGRVIKEKCFSTSGTEFGMEILPVCQGGSTEADSSLTDSHNSDNFSHGSHVAGVAAGKDGFAPEANIIAVQIFSESYRSYLAEPYRYGSILDPADEAKGYNYLIGLADAGEKIDIVNMSYGYSQYAAQDNCPNIWQAEYFTQMTEKGILLVAASGNDSLTGSIIPPACNDKTISVGALDSTDEIAVAPFSNHSEKLNITAPGTGIWSAFLCQDGRTDCYAAGDGTSAAAPMVSGALAILKSAIPGYEAEKYVDFLYEISDLNVSKMHRYIPYSQNTYTMDTNYSIPVLNFSKIAEVVDNYKLPDPDPEPDPDPDPDPHPDPEPEPQPVPSEEEFTLYPFFHTGTVLPATGISGTLTAVKPDGLQYKDMNMTLQIPSIDVQTNIVNVPLEGEEYPVTWLGASAGLLSGYPLPGEGRTIITGHNHLNAEETGPFALLQFVNIGDSIIISRGNDMDIYTVYANEKISETDLEALGKIAAGDEKAVIFITCEDERIEGGYANRRIVAAMPK